MFLKAGKDAVDEEKEIAIPTNRPEMKDFVKNILHPIDHLHGDDLPVSKFVDRADGVYPQGSAAFEKEVLQLLFLNGTVQSVPSVTFVQWFALTL